MTTLHGGYGLKGLGFLLFIVAFTTALFLGPVAGEPPLDPGPDLPAMSNVPAPGVPPLTLE